MTHTTAERLPIGRHTSARWAMTASATKAIVFVHGFRGSALKSWGDTPDLAAEDPRFDDADLFFYGYETRGRQIATFAYELRWFLQAIAGWSQQLLGRTVAWQERATAPSYDTILVVAHSLGAVIARRAMLDGLNESETWVGRTRFVLFAPAHMGAFSIKTLLELTASKVLPVPFEAWMRTRYPVLNQLEPGSKALENLHSEVSVALPKHAANLSARHVAIAEIEEVVDTTPFIGDAAGVPIRGTQHISIIKSRFRDSTVLERIWKAIGRPLAPSIGRST